MEWATEIFEWFKHHRAVFWIIASFSAALFVGTLLVLPLLLSRIPEDYFVNTNRGNTKAATSHPFMRILLLVIKNIVGVAFLVSGIVMLALPGQGLLTMLVGILLINFPGKFRLERALIRQPFLHKPIDWIRSKSGKPPLILPAPEGASHE